MRVWLNRSHALGQGQCLKRVFALQNDCPLRTRRLFLQPGTHGDVPGPSSSQAQGLTLNPSWREAQEAPTPSWGRGWKDTLWFALAEPGRASLRKEEAPASAASPGETPKPGVCLFYGKDMLTRASCIRNFEARVLLVFLLRIVNFQHTLSWQVMLLVVIKPRVPSFLNGHKVRAIPRGDGSCSVQQMPVKICVHLPPHLSGESPGN